jgi:hypothetical protein
MSGAGGGVVDGQPGTGATDPLATVVDRTTTLPWMRPHPEQVRVVSAFCVEQWAHFQRLATGVFPLGAPDAERRPIE